jgi:hypothetical protein
MFIGDMEAIFQLHFICKSSSPILSPVDLLQISQNGIFFNSYPEVFAAGV